MHKSKEELGRLHKEKCKELKQIRAQIAADLGIDLKQSECTYEGYCSGTCPKCKSEEMKLNLAIMKQQMESADLKRKVAAAGLTTVAALSLSGCNAVTTTLEGDVRPIENMYQTEGVAPAPETEMIDGDIEYSEPEESSETSATPETEAIEGKLVVPEPTEEVEILEGDVVCIEEPSEETKNE